MVDQGYDLHEAKIADLDGNGTLDILGKPYNWDTPRLEIWLRGKQLYGGSFEVSRRSVYSVGTRNMAIASISISSSGRQRIA